MPSYVAYLYNMQEKPYLLLLHRSASTRVLHPFPCQQICSITICGEYCLGAVRRSFIYNCDSILVQVYHPARPPHWLWDQSTTPFLPEYSSLAKSHSNIKSSYVYILFTTGRICGWSLASENLNLAFKRPGMFVLGLHFLTYKVVKAWFDVFLGQSLILDEKWLVRILC